jgi:hypothetical protein
MPEIKYLPSFQQDLNAIIDYITFTLEAPSVPATRIISGPACPPGYGFKVPAYAQTTTTL